MIPEYLEELIWKGEARWRTWCTGGSSVARIPVTKNTYIVVTAMTYFPFVDEGTALDFFEWQGAFIFRQVHQVILATSKNKFQYNYRDWYTMTQDTIGGISTMMSIGGEPKVQKMYCVFDQNVRINIRSFVGNVASSWLNFDAGKMPDTSKELPAPLYQGIAAQASSTNTIRNFQFSAGNTVVDPTNGEVPLGPLTFFSNPQYQERIFAVVPPTSFLNTRQTGMNYPLLNFDYVEVLRPLPGNLRP